MEDFFLRAVIFANGQLSNPELVHTFPGDFIIAADGGHRHCLRAGLTPQAVIGDFDSLDQASQDQLKALGVPVIRHPRRKDFTDLELALQYAVEQGADEIIVYAALGLRWDMTLANLLLPAAGNLSAARIWLLDGQQEITLLRAGQTVTITGRPGDTVSLIPVGGDAHGITTKGLEYPLNNETLFFGATRGVSNVLLSSSAQVQISAGMLICTLIRLEQ